MGLDHFASFYALSVIEGERSEFSPSCRVHITDNLTKPNFVPYEVMICAKISWCFGLHNPYEEHFRKNFMHFWLS